jgi:chromosome segregation ATPase
LDRGEINMKSNYDGFRGWLNYIRDYKDNKDLLGENLKEKELQDTIEKLTTNSKEKDNLLALRNQRIDVLNQEITDLKQRNDELRRNLNTTMKENEKLQEKVKEKEKARRKNAGAIGGLKAKINELTKDLERANQKITWLKTNQKAPTKEEIIAYETRMKEVEKRQKEK